VCKQDNYSTDQNPYLPHRARIIRTLPRIADHQLFHIRLENEQIVQDFIYRPGQFVMLSVVGTGEAPFSISSFPARPGIIELRVRRIGWVTNALFRIPPNTLVDVRSPYGNGFPVEQLEGNNLLLVAGGLGMAQLRLLLLYVLDKRSKFGKITLMYGKSKTACRSWCLCCLGWCTGHEKRNPTGKNIKRGI